MVPSWVNPWVGFPYKEEARGPDAFDCLGLYIHLNWVRRRVVIPDPACGVAQAVRRNVIGQLRSVYEEVTAPEEGDAVLMVRGRHPVHVGYCVDARHMIHTEKEAVGAVVKRYSSPVIAGRIVGFFRYVGPAGHL